MMSGTNSGTSNITGNASNKNDSAVIERAANEEDESEEGDGAEEILEESPCKRWSKRRERVKQREVPGIDFAYLAMDNETGNEVVWNEVQFSERKNFRDQEEKINAIFENLTHLSHTNLVKFHKYWTDTKSEKPRVIFITEYMSSGSLALFLQRTRKSGSSLSGRAWKRWTTQILSALNYLHSRNPPIVHANLTCDTMFIQHNGLIKIGCVAPNAIHHHVKTFRENIKNMHYVAPEYEYCTTVDPSADVYSFGICALEMALPVGLCGCSNGSESASVITPEMIKKALNSIEDPMQKNFIVRCLEPDPVKRPTARELLFHTILFEVHSLKLLAAHRVVDSKLVDSIVPDDLRVSDHQKIAAVSKFQKMSYGQVNAFQVDLEKFIEDVSNGIYPLTAFAPLAHQQKMTASTSATFPAGDVVPDDHSFETVDRTEATPSPPDNVDDIYRENRSVLKLSVSLSDSLLTVMIQLDDLMNRKLTTELHGDDTPHGLAAELVQHGLVAQVDQLRIATALSEVLKSSALDKDAVRANSGCPSADVSQTTPATHT